MFLSVFPVEYCLPEYCVFSLPEYCLYSLHPGIMLIQSFSQNIFNLPIRISFIFLPEYRLSSSQNIFYLPPRIYFIFLPEYCLSSSQNIFYLPPRISFIFPQSIALLQSSSYIEYCPFQLSTKSQRLLSSFQTSILVKCML